ncbi:cell filamentation protein Fic, partial [Bathymodiolus thermophilus thioautotrophic gill symbiont]
MYLDYAEDQAEKGVPMTMYDWSEKLNAFLRFNDREVLEDCGQITAAIAKSFAHSEFEKYRPIQDKLFESDFDKV